MEDIQNGIDRLTKSLKETQNDIEYERLWAERIELKEKLNLI